MGSLLLNPSGRPQVMQYESERQLLTKNGSLVSRSRVRSRMLAARSRRCSSFSLSKDVEAVVASSKDVEAVMTSTLTRKRSVSYSVRAKKRSSTERKDAVGPDPEHGLPVDEPDPASVLPGESLASFTWSPLPPRKSTDKNVCVALFCDDTWEKIEEFEALIDSLPGNEQLTDEPTPSHSYTHATPSHSNAHVTPSHSYTHATPSHSYTHVTPSHSYSNAPTPSHSSAPAPTPSHSASYVGAPTPTHTPVSNTLRRQDKGRVAEELFSGFKEDDYSLFMDADLYGTRNTPDQPSMRPYTNPQDTPTRHPVVLQNPSRKMTGIGKEDLTLESLHDLTWLRRMDPSEQMILEVHVIWSILTLMVVLLACYSIQHHSL